MEIFGIDITLDVVMLLTAAILAVPLSIFALRVNFDINIWLQNRAEQDKEKLKSVCTHTYVDVEQNNKNGCLLYTSDAADE